MTIKETVYTEMDDRGRVVSRRRTVDVYEDRRDRAYDEATRYGCGCVHNASGKRIYEAVRDYYTTKEW